MGSEMCIRDRRCCSGLSRDGTAWSLSLPLTGLADGDICRDVFCISVLPRNARSPFGSGFVCHAVVHDPNANDVAASDLDVHWPVFGRGRLVERPEGRKLASETGEQAKWLNGSVCFFGSFDGYRWFGRRRFKHRNVRSFKVVIVVCRPVVRARC